MSSPRILELPDLVAFSFRPPCRWGPCRIVRRRLFLSNSACPEMTAARPVLRYRVTPRRARGGRRRRQRARSVRTGARAPWPRFRRLRSPRRKRSETSSRTLARSAPSRAAALLKGGGELTFVIGGSPRAGSRVLSRCRFELAPAAGGDVLCPILAAHYNFAVGDAERLLKARRRAGEGDRRRDARAGGGAHAARDNRACRRLDAAVTCKRPYKLSNRAERLREAAVQGRTFVRDARFAATMAWQRCAAVAPCNAPEIRRPRGAAARLRLRPN